MFCIECGAVLGPTNKFCGSCGAPVCVKRKGNYDSVVLQSS